MTDKTVFLGFDGFVDRILRPIKSRAGDITTPFLEMGEFGQYLKGQDGRSCSVELELLEKRMGGNMPNVAKALGELGFGTVCVGAMGYPEVLPEFSAMPEHCRLLSVADPGYCDSLEFGDGKVMLAINAAINTLDYEKIIEIVPEEDLVKALSECDGAAFLNWGEMPNSNDIWANIAGRILPRCSFPAKKTMLIDFSDFSGRNTAEVCAMLDIFKSLQTYFNITVSLNDNELHLILAKTGKSRGGEIEDEDILAVSRLFFESNVVVHYRDRARYTADGRVHTVPKEVLENPKLITGGGDNFNAGLLAGLLTGEDLGRAVRLGNAVVNHFVMTGDVTAMGEALRLNNFIK